MNSSELAYLDALMAEAALDADFNDLLDAAIRELGADSEQLDWLIGELIGHRDELLRMRGGREMLLAALEVNRAANILIGYREESLSPIRDE